MPKASIPEFATSTKIVRFASDFVLENNAVLPGIEIAYTTSGTLNANRSNVVWICHALTANANPAEWWPGLVGTNDLICPEKYFIVCANVLGSCYGSTGPLSESVIGTQQGYSNFPLLTIRDLVKAHHLLADYLGIQNIYLLMGGSLGGQQALEWSIQEPKRIHHLFLIATNAVHSPYGIAFNESQRMAIFADKTYDQNHKDGGSNGLKAARAIALLSYRSYAAYTATQKEEDDAKVDDFRAAGYQRYQGDKLVNRFNAYAYVCLSKTMDSHNVGRNRQSVEKALSGIQAKTLCVGISSDALFPVAEQRFLQKHIPQARYSEIESFYGHDGFLIETEKLTLLLQDFLSHDNTKIA